MIKSFDIQWFALLVDDSTEEINLSTIPVYYKECLLAFQELNRKGLIKLKNSILWCNSCIKFQGRVLSFNEWSKCGVKYISDVLINGSINQGCILEKLNRKAGFIFEFSKLLKSLPSTMVRSCDSKNVPTLENLEYNIPGQKCSKSLLNLTTKDIYTILLLSEEHVIKSESYWTNKLGYRKNEFNSWYNKLFVNYIIPRKILDFNWRVFHGQVVTENRLKKMNLSNGICSLCHLEIEDIEHLFCRCNAYSEIWTTAESMLRALGVTRLTNFNRIVGIIDSSHGNDVFNMILSITRWVIWKRRCSKKYGGLISLSSAKFELKSTIFKHIQVLLYYKTNISDNSKQQLMHLLDLIEPV